MHMNDYQDAATRTLNPGVTFGMVNNAPEQLVNAAMGLAGEAGEVVDVVKKVAFHGHDLSTPRDGRTHYRRLVDELGDVLWYCAVLADALNVRLGDVATQNVEKLRRRYPDGFSVADSMAKPDENP